MGQRRGQRRDTEGRSMVQVEKDEDSDERAGERGRRYGSKEVR